MIKPTEITLSAEQNALFNRMENTNGNIFATGRAGTGKSVVLRHFMANTKKKALIAAPTGIAALNVGGATIHSLFGLGFDIHRKGTLKPNEKIAAILKRIDTLVIDEISMVRADILDAVSERFQEACNNKLPFGGKQVIMFGDMFQLPPVVDRDLVEYFQRTYGGHFFFNAHVWTKSIFEGFKIYELTQVFRQKDSTFRDILNDVREGKYTADQLDTLNARYGQAVPLEGTVTLAATNNLVTRINQQKLNQLKGKLFSYTAIITGNMTKGSFPTEEILQLKEGAQIVMLKNDVNKKWVNGTVGKIEKLTDKGIEVNIKGLVYALEVNTWEEMTYTVDETTNEVETKVASSFTQYPVRLAWAMTIHKSQGQTYESVALDLSIPTFAAGQMYVALSRCTGLEGLYITQPVKASFIMVDAQVIDFMSRRETIDIKVESNVVETTLIEVLDSNLIETAPETSVEEPETAIAIVEQPAPVKNKAGRKAYDASDKKVTTAYVVDPSINEALKLFSAGLDESQSDALTAALLDYAPFKAFFEGSKQHADYIERQERIAASKVDKKAKKVKKVVATEPETELGKLILTRIQEEEKATEPDPTPDNDPSGAPAPQGIDQEVHTNAESVDQAPLIDQEVEQDLALIRQIAGTHLVNWSRELSQYELEVMQQKKKGEVIRGFRKLLKEKTSQELSID